MADPEPEEEEVEPTDEELAAKFGWEEGDIEAEPGDEDEDEEDEEDEDEEEDDES